MQSFRYSFRIVCLAACMAVTFGLWSQGVQAGGNTQVRNPANPSEVFDRKWDERMLPLTWVLSEDGIPGSGISNATLTTELTAAFDSWETLPTSKLGWTFGGELPIHSTGLGGPLGAGIDGRNLITFTDSNLIFPPGVLGVALTFSFTSDTVIDASNSDLDGDSVADIPEGLYPAGTIFDGDIAFNSSEDWKVDGVSGPDIQSVALHEIGHTFGLAHSMVRNVVMWPFLNNDIPDARIPKPDDIAFASFFYPEEPAYSAAFGGITGQIINGFSSGPVLGAHVFAVDSASGATIAGAYSGDNGSYTIPGLTPGNYLVAIEPLDGDPTGLDPARINQVVQFTFDTNFPEEFYDAAESNVEPDPNAGIAVGVAAGSNTVGIDLVTNTLQVPGVNVIFESGYNLFSYPVGVPGGLSSFDLLQAIGDDTVIVAVDRFVPSTGTFERATYVNGVPAGANFPIERGVGYVVHMAAQKVVQFLGSSDCPNLDLERGLNLIGAPCPPAGYTSFLMQKDIGARFEVESIKRFDPDTGTFQSATYDVLDESIGDDFPIVNGEGLIVKMLADKASVQIPGPGTRLAPVITGISPGEGVSGNIVVILGDGFDSDPTKNTVTFNGIGASVVFATSTSITTTVPGGANSGLVRVAVGGQQSNGIQFDVRSSSVAEISGTETPLVSGQTASGTLGADGEQDRYTFTALAGSLVTISATSIVPGVPDLVLLLEDPFGVVVSTDDNGGGGSDPRINNFELRKTGKHTIVVSNLPGSGLGGYNLSLTVTTRATAPQVSILGGNFQTGLAGTQLPIPLSVMVTGATGAPVSGVNVNFVATETTFGLTDPAFAGTTVVSTNSSGIVSVGAALPTQDGRYTITVTVDGIATSATFTIAGSNKLVTTIELSGDQQTGVVNQALDNPLQVVLKDSIGGLVGNALVAFAVVSGNGTLSGDPCQGDPAICVTTAPTTGLAETTWTIGKKIDEPQLVAVFVPGLVEPMLFEAIPEADQPSSAISNKSNFSRLTLGTSALNAMQIQVFDQYGNPVKNALVNYNANGGLIVNPGLGPNGQVFQNFLTNDDGLHVARLSALYQTTEPTIDEFGNSIAGIHSVSATVVGGSAPSESYAVDVDLGPSMITSSGQNIGHIIGQPLPNPVTKRVLRWERVDTFIDGNMDGMDDDDNGDFTNENFNILTQKGVDGVTINLEVRREDGRDAGAAGVTPMTLSSMTTMTDSSGFGSVDVTNMGDVGGVNSVSGRIDQIFIEWFYEDGSVIDSKTFTDEQNFGESTNLIAIPVVITIDLDDVDSGIDFSTVIASLNGTAFFDAGAPPAVLPVFPELLQVTIGGVALPGLDADIINTSAFKNVQIVYQPKASRLLMGANAVTLQLVKDRAENEQTTAATGTINYP